MEQIRGVVFFLCQLTMHQVLIDLGLASTRCVGQLLVMIWFKLFMIFLDGANSLRVSPA